jgi:hypothetical protein
VPEQILRKFRIFGHHIKHSPVEKMIYKMFPFGCPLPLGQAVQRFSGDSMPSSVAQELLMHHFSRLGSTLGEYSLPMTSEISQVKFSFVDGSLRDVNKECSICLDTITKKYSFAICGHVYCSDCAIKFFRDEFAQQKHKECAMCRTTLLTADVFNIDEEKAFKPSLSSKDQAVQNFIKASKTGNVKNWRDFSFGGRYVHDAEQIKDSKTIIVEKPFECSAKNILEIFADSIVPISFNVFYTTQEKKYFLNLQASF